MTKESDGMKKALKITLEVLKWLFIVLLLVVLLLNVIILIMRAVTKDVMPQVFGLSAAIVVSGSMSPTIETYDLVIVKNTDDFEIGDIITFYNGKNYVTHRIVEKTENGFVTKGDANNNEDATVVKTNDIKGEVVKIVPNVGKAINFFLSPQGIAVLFAVLLFFFTVSKAYDKKRKTI